MDFENARSQAENARPAARPLTPLGRDEASADNRKPTVEPAQATEVRSVWKASRGDIRALERKLDHLSRTNAELSAGGARIVAMRAEIAEIRRSLADLAPRNAVVALEGAIRDLSQRVEILRQNGHRETLLAPLEAMAEEMRATVKAHDPQAVAAILEGEIRSIGAKIDSLGQSAVNPETFERIRAQTEEVRNLLAAAATRAAPAERIRTPDRRARRPCRTSGRERDAASRDPSDCDRARRFPQGIRTLHAAARSGLDRTPARGDCGAARPGNRPSGPGDIRHAAVR